MLLASLRARTALLAVLLLSAACDQGAHPPTQAPSPPPDLANYVTGAAAAALGPEGRFPDTEPPPRERPMISRARAGVLALAYVHSYGQFMRRSWEEERGATIRVDALRADPRVYFAESPYGAFPEGPYHPAFRRDFGPYYLVILVEGTEPVLLVAVSAFNTDVGVDERGDVHETWLGGAEFMSAAFPRDARKYHFPTPEQAVERVARTTGARANQAPELVLRGRYHPSLAVWKVSLDRDASVRPAASGARRLVDALYVDGAGRSLTPAADQPESAVLNLPIGPPWEPEVRRTMPARIPVVPGRAVNYDVVIVDAAQ